MAFIDIGSARLWVRDENVEYWIIIHKESKKIVEPRSKGVFESSKNALKSLYNIFGSKANAEPYLNEFDIVKLAEYDSEQLA